MPLESIARLLAGCQAGGYAVGYFESWNLESLQGVLDAAEQTRSPVIVGFNGEFLSHSGRLAAERLTLYAALGQAAAESSSVPCGLIFNECPDDSWVLAAVEAGFNLVMPADPSCSYDDYARRVTRIVARAHDRQVAVEAELGELPSGAAGLGKQAGQLTDPDVAERFVSQTGVDLLAVSVGNRIARLLREGLTMAVHRTHAPGDLSAERSVAQPGGHFVCRRAETRAGLSVLAGRARRPDQVARPRGDLPGADAQGRSPGGDLLQSAGPPVAAGGPRTLPGPGPDRHAVLLGQPLAAGARQDHRLGDRRPRPVHAVPQQRRELVPEPAEALAYGAA